MRKHVLTVIDQAFEQLTSLAMTFLLLLNVERWIPSIGNLAIDMAPPKG